MRRVAAAVVLVLAALAGVTGCSGSAAGGPRIEASDEPSEVWQPVHLRLVALPPGERVTVQAHVASVVLGGPSWSSEAVYAIPSSGIVDLDDDVPLEAPFTGADGMGLFWSLRSDNGDPATSQEQWAGSTLTVELDALVDGRRIAVRRLHRVGLSSVAPSRAVFDDGITGDYFAPARGVRAPGPAVLVFDGTEPDVQTGILAAATLSAMGYPALALSTYGSAGQLEPVRTLPAERVVAALDWLRAQPGVDPRRVFVFGTSRGAQLALWTAAAHPELVYGAIAPAGTTGLVCPSPVPVPAVTVGGAWVPCVSGTREVSPASVLDLRRIPGPVILGCAGRDEQLDNGCQWLDAAAALRPARGGDAYVRAPQSGHVFYAPPYTPLHLPPAPQAQATEDARVALWSAIARALNVRGP